MALLRPPWVSLFPNGIDRPRWLARNLAWFMLLGLLSAGPRLLGASGLWASLWWLVATEVAVRAPPGGHVAWRVGGVAVLGLSTALPFLLVGQAIPIAGWILCVVPASLSALVFTLQPLVRLAVHAEERAAARRLDAGAWQLARGLRLAVLVLSALAFVFRTGQLLAMTALAVSVLGGLVGLDRHRRQWLERVARGEVPGWSLVPPTEHPEATAAPFLDEGTHGPWRLLVRHPEGAHQGVFRSSASAEVVAVVGERRGVPERLGQLLWGLGLLSVQAALYVMAHQTPFVRLIIALFPRALE
jgi:hypothetical protein